MTCRLYQFINYALRPLLYPALRPALLPLAVVCLWLVPLRAGSVAAPGVGEVAGVVMLRGEGAGAGVTRLRQGDVLPPDGVAVVTGAGSRVELVAADGGVCRVGSLALWMPSPAGGRLLSGTVLVDVPEGRERAVDSTTGRARLGSGLWIVQAMHNEGLKLICLDGPGAVVAAGGAEPAGDAPARLTLRPGELVFLRPGGREFGPVVTIFLQELLVTSRLVNGFSQPAPRAARLRWQALAQAERLGRVTNALVAGARDGEGFQLVVPRGAPDRKRAR
ncbi:MAG: hypothetical protein ABII82_13125 [Verrucomicrobiota bacterium]